MQECCSDNHIPYCHTTEGYQYLTFAGYLVNKAIALVTKKPTFEAGDFSLLVSSPIDWASVPQEPSGYEGIFPLLFESSLELSVFQQQLPSSLQLREYLQDWLKDETISKILKRLGQSKAKPIERLKVAFIV